MVYYTIATCCYIVGFVTAFIRNYSHTIIYTIYIRRPLKHLDLVIMIHAPKPKRLYTLCFTQFHTTN